MRDFCEYHFHYSVPWGYWGTYCIVMIARDGELCDCIICPMDGLVLVCRVNVSALEYVALLTLLYNQATSS